jgi:hypothetical protein
VPRDEASEGVRVAPAPARRGGSPYPGRL